MSQTNEKLDEVNSKLDEINRKLDGPTVWDEISEKARDSLDNTIQSTTRNVCFAGQARRAKFSNKVNRIINVIAWVIVLIGIISMLAIGQKGLFICLIGMLLLGSTPIRKHIEDNSEQK